MRQLFFGKGRVSGEQMLTVGRGLRTTATDQWRAFPASGPAAVIYVSVGGPDHFSKADYDPASRPQGRVLGA